MAQRVNIRERLKMLFLTVDYKEKLEAYGTNPNAADTGSIVLDVLNIPDAVLEELRRIEAGAGVDDELMDTIQMMAAIMDGMKDE